MTQPQGHAESLLLHSTNQKQVTKPAQFKEKTYLRAKSMIYWLEATECLSLEQLSKYQKNIQKNVNTGYTDGEVCFSSKHVL